jgi:hypothetical protein
MAGLTPTSSNTTLVPTCTNCTGGDEWLVTNQHHKQECQGVSRANEQKETKAREVVVVEKEYFVGVPQGVDERRVEGSTTASHKRCACGER